MVDHRSLIFHVLTCPGGGGVIGGLVHRWLRAFWYCLQNKFINIHQLYSCHRKTGVEVDLFLLGVFLIFFLSDPG